MTLLWRQQNAVGKQVQEQMDMLNAALVPADGHETS